MVTGGQTGCLTWQSDVSMGSALSCDHGAGALHPSQPRACAEGWCMRARGGGRCGGGCGQWMWVLKVMTIWGMMKRSELSYVVLCGITEKISRVPGSSVTCGKTVAALMHRFRRRRAQGGDLLLGMGSCKLVVWWFVGGWCMFGCRRFGARGMRGSACRCADGNWKSNHLRPCGAYYFLFALVQSGALLCSRCWPEARCKG